VPPPSKKIRRPKKATAPPSFAPGGSRSCATARGDVQAPDAGTAAAAAVSEFDLSEEERKRLVVRGTNSRWERCRYGWWLDAAGRETHRDHSSKLSPPTPAGEDGGFRRRLMSLKDRRGQATF
jgi:hypothetical protein